MNTQPTELDKAIERDAEYLRLKDDAFTGLDGSPGNDTSKFAFETINTLIKRLKDVEKERDELNKTIDTITTDENYKGGVQYWIKRDTEHMRERDDLHHRMMGQPYGEQVFQLKRELSTLRTGYKQALEVLDNGLLNLRHVVSALHANNTISPDARDAINRMKEVLSTPLAIATMKGGQ